jgi:hypothetical protein
MWDGAVDGTWFETSQAHVSRSRCLLRVLLLLDLEAWRHSPQGLKSAALLEHCDAFGHLHREWDQRVDHKYPPQSTHLAWCQTI